MSRTTAPDRPLTSTTAGTERSARDAPDARRIPGIDGLRAVAVLGVMAFHFELGLDGGFLGVDLFFVISGFVITRLLAAERSSSGRIGLGRFWFRRVKRLMPALFVTVAAVQVWMVLQDPPGLRPTTNGQTLAALGYVSNWYAIVAQVDYWAVAGSAAPLSHLWSLAVEEQFYLCWPALLAVGLGCAAVRRRPGLVAAVVAG
ncbi:acyltransferase family protein, partial [Actinocorallia lasiicapitis]